MYSKLDLLFFGCLVISRYIIMVQVLCMLYQTADHIYTRRFVSKGHFLNTTTKLSKPFYNRLGCGIHKIRNSCQLDSVQFVPMGLLISSWQTILYGLRWQKVMFHVNNTFIDHGVILSNVGSFFIQIRFPLRLIGTGL